MPLDWFGKEHAASRLRLSAAERRGVTAEAEARLPRDRMVRHAAFVVAPPVLAAIALSVLLDGWVGRQLGVPRIRVLAVMIGVIVVASVPWFAWAFGRLQVRQYREVLRERGSRRCVGCGYAMDGLAAPSACPECGEMEPE